MPEDRSPRRRFTPKQRYRPATKRQFRYGRWLLAALPIALAGAGTYAVLQSPLLTVQEVRVAGAQTLDAAALVQISGLEGESMLRLPLDDARKRLQALPQVKSVEFERDWPNELVLRVRERQPFAFWSVGGRDYVVDAEGFVLAAGAPSGPAPRIVEPDANRVMGPGDRVHPDALALAARIFQESPTVVGQGVRLLEYRPDVGVTAVFDGGMRVTFGDDRAYEYKLAVLTQLLTQLQARGARANAVDLRFGERATYE